MKSLTENTSNDDPSEPSIGQVFEKTKEATNYEPGETEFSRAARAIAEELSNSVTEENQYSTYDELFSIDPEAFQMLDETAGQKGLFTCDQAQEIEEGGPVKWTGLSLDGSDDHYDGGCAGSNAAAVAVYQSEHPETDFSIEKAEELQNYVESFEKAMERRIGDEYSDKALNGLETGLRKRGVDLRTL